MYKGMDSSLIEQLEERLTGFQDTDSMELNEFEDSDLAMYPAIEISQINLTADQCETIANNLIKMISTGDKDLLTQAARAMAVLAYNALMDREAPYNHDNAVPFFHKYTTNEYTEDWLRTSGTSEVDLETLSCRQIQEPDLALVLVNLGASEFERKASIGAWAFAHLRALWGGGKGFAEDFRQLISFVEREIIFSLYHFGCAYKYPRLKQSVFNQICRRNQPEEMMYLLYRAAIIYEKIQRRPSMNNQRALLDDLVFGGNIRLRYAGIQLWTLLRSASRKLHISETQLLDDLDWALRDPRWIRYSDSSLKAVKFLREFRRKFEEGSFSRNASRYYMYARLVNYYHFYYLGMKASKELANALVKLSTGRTEVPAVSVYERWGQLIAQKILEFRSLNYKIDGLRVIEDGIDVSQFDYVEKFVLVPPF